MPSHHRAEISNFEFRIFHPTFSNFHHSSAGEPQRHRGHRGQHRVSLTWPRGNRGATARVQNASLPGFFQHCRRSIISLEATLNTLTSRKGAVGEAQRGFPRAGRRAAGTETDTGVSRLRPYPPRDQAAPGPGLWSAGPSTTATWVAGVRSRPAAEVFQARRTPRCRR